MSIRIQFRGGPLAGRVFSFEDDVDEIVVGRDPGQCHVVLPAELTQVGRQHLALRQVLGRYRVILNRENPVFVDGRAAMDEMELPPVAQVQLGKGGPVMVVKTMLSDALPETELHGAAPLDPQAMLSRAARRTGTNLRIALLTAGGIVVLAVIGFLAFSKTRKEVEDVIEQQAQVRALLDTEMTGLRQQAEEHRQAADELRGHLDSVRDVLGELQPDISQLRETIAGLGPRMEGLEERIEQQSPQIQAGLARASPSVYLVLLRDPEGTVEAVGTAWVAGDGVLATNAHVAAIYAETEAGGSLENHAYLVRSNERPPRDFVVSRVEMHPGYGDFEEIWDSYRPAELGIGGRFTTMDTAGACDVALLHVEDPEGLGSPLAIAPQEALHRVDAGDVVGFVGYPTEGLIGPGVNLQAPVPHTQIAHVTAVTNFFMASTAPENGFLVQHSLPAAGGASGSPILDIQGRVVAVLNAGNMALGGTGERIPTGALVNFAQRADLVGELLAGRAGEVQSERTKTWRQDIETFASVRDLVRDVAMNYLRDELAEAEQGLGVEPVQLHESSGVLAPPEGAIQVHHHLLPFEVPGPGIYVFFAYSIVGEDIDLRVLAANRDEVIEQDEEEDLHPLVAIRSTGRGRVRVMVYGYPGRVENGEYRLLIYRFGS